MAKHKAIAAKVRLALDLSPDTPVGSLIWVMPDGQGSFDFLGSMYTADHFGIDEETQKWERAIAFWASDRPVKSSDWQKEWLGIWESPAKPKGERLQ
jgi:hypothetical protein